MRSCLRSVVPVLCSELCAGLIQGTRGELRRVIRNNSGAFICAGTCRIASSRTVVRKMRSARTSRKCAWDYFCLPVISNLSSQKAVKVTRSRTSVAEYILYVGEN